MEDDLFNQLLESVEEMGEILRNERQPSRENIVLKTEFENKNSNTGQTKQSN